MPNYYKKNGKRCLDLLVTIMLIPLIFPLAAVVFLLVRILVGTPVFFCQRRPGFKGKLFSIYKFRTMSNSCDEDSNLLPDHERLTKFGMILRQSSLDELPEFINVLKGEMTLVGPRPLLREYLQRYSPEQARRHETRPGITGWAQINGRNALTWEEKFEFDVWYVENISFKLDMKILWLSLWYVLKRKDISHAGHTTMNKFKGTGNVKTEDTEI